MIGSRSASTQNANTHDARAFAAPVTPPVKFQVMAGTAIMTHTAHTASIVSTVSIVRIATSLKTCVQLLIQLRNRL